MALDNRQMVEELQKEIAAKKKIMRRSTKKHAPKHGSTHTHLCERNERGVMWPTQAMSTLERQFLNCWQHQNGPDLERETAFDREAGGNRGWRADFVHRQTMTMIEIEGGAWSGGRHTRGSGFIEDATKYLRAWELGWNVLRLSSGQINIADVGRIVAKLRGEDAEKAPAPSWLRGLPS
jgi:very-short-patch-repair endonuclease